MKRTPHIRGTLRSLADINDQLWFFLFAQEHVKAALAAVPDERSHHYTTEEFGTNPHAMRIHVPVGTLATFQDAHETFTFGSFFAVSYEIVTSYYRSAMRTLRQYSGKSIVEAHADAPEERLELLCQHSGIEPPPAEILNTLKYMRLRRNHFIHLIDEPDANLRALLGTEGAKLTSYWDGVRDMVDFRDPWPDIFTHDETIALLKILQIAVGRLDHHVAGCLDDQVVAETTFDNFIGNRTLGTDGELRWVCRKIRGRILHAFGSAPDCDWLVEVYGARGLTRGCT